MKKIYALLFSMLAVTGVAAQKPVMAAGSTTCYTGSLDVTMMGAPIATGQSATVTMIEDAEGNFTASRISLSPWVEASLNAATLSWKASLALIWKATAFTTLPVLSMIFRWRKVRFMRKSTFPARKMPKPAQSIWTLKWVGTRVIPMIWKAQCRSL